jgi:hypothetical protein
MPGVLRVLVVNFAQADTGWPDFLGWPDITKRIEDTVWLIAGELTASLSYDLVLPARLDIECFFGQPVWLNSSLEAQGGSFIEAAGVTRLRVELRSRKENPDLDELLELGVDRATQESVEG